MYSRITAGKLSPRWTVCI